MRLKVIFRNGTTEAVLSDVPEGREPDVEIVNIDDDYSDAEELEAYADKLYADPSLREIPYATADFEEDENE